MAIKEKGLSLTENETKNVIEELARETEKNEISFVWYGEEMVEGEAKTSGEWEYSMCIEPNGDVTPCEYEYKSFGNIQKDEWKGIWNKAIKYNRGK